MSRTYTCKYVGQSDCNFELTLDDDFDLLVGAWEHMEEKHEEWMHEFLRKNGMVEFDRLIIQAIEKV